MDGVLTDFVGHACTYHGIENPYESGEKQSYNMAELVGMCEDDFWGPLGSLAFWRDMPKTDIADKIIQVSERRVGPENVYVLTSPSASGFSATGKMRWIDRHFQQLSRRIIITPQKHLLATPTRVLIDDSDSNVDRDWET